MADTQTARLSLWSFFPFKACIYCICFRFVFKLAVLWSLRSELSKEVLCSEFNELCPTFVSTLFSVFLHYMFATNIIVFNLFYPSPHIFICKHVWFPGIHQPHWVPSWLHLSLVFSESHKRYAPSLSAWGTQRDGGQGQLRARGMNRKNSHSERIVSAIERSQNAGNRI